MVLDSESLGFPTVQDRGWGRVGHRPVAPTRRVPDKDLTHGSRDEKGHVCSGVREGPHVPLPSVLGLTFGACGSKFRVGTTH